MSSVKPVFTKRNVLLFILLPAILLSHFPWGKIMSKFSSKTEKDDRNSDFI